MDVFKSINQHVKVGSSNILGEALTFFYKFEHLAILSILHDYGIGVPLLVTQAA